MGISIQRIKGLHSVGWYGSTDEPSGIAIEALLNRVSELEAFVETRRKDHYYCDDPWYSCPLAMDGCADDQVEPDKCNCQADEWNAEIDAMLKKGDGIV